MSTTGFWEAVYEARPRGNNGGVHRLECRGGDVQRATVTSPEADSPRSFLHRTEPSVVQHLRVGLVARHFWFGCLRHILHQPPQRLSLADHALKFRDEVSVFFARLWVQTFQSREDLAWWPADDAIEFSSRGVEAFHITAPDYIRPTGPRIAKPAVLTPPPTLPSGKAVSDQYKSLIVGSEIYNDVTVRMVFPDSIAIIYRDGVITIPLANVSKEIQDKYSYDPAYAAEYISLKAAHAQYKNDIAKQAEEKQHEITSGEDKPTHAPIAVTSPVLCSRLWPTYLGRCECSFPKEMKVSPARSLKNICARPRASRHAERCSGTSKVGISLCGGALATQRPGA